MTAVYSSRDLQRTADDLTLILAHALAVLDRRDLQRPLPHSGLEEITAGLCYERQAA